MELCKTRFTTSLGKIILDKFILDYNNESFSQLCDFLYNTQIEESILIKSQFDKNIRTVLKFGSTQNIENEYIISKKLKELPNFINFLCKIKLNSDILTIISEYKNITKMHRNCINYDNILVMEYYELGSIDNLEWNKNNFNIIINIIKQVIFATLYAFFEIGFLHMNLHYGNILLKPKTNTKICYGSKELFIEDYEVIIMDYDQSKLGQDNKKDLFFKNINRFLTTLGLSLLNKNIVFYYDNNKIYDILNTDGNINYYDEIDKIIDTFKLKIFRDGIE